MEIWADQAYNSNPEVAKMALQVWHGRQKFLACRLTGAVAWALQVPAMLKRQELLGQVEKTAAETVQLVRQGEKTG